MVPLVLLFMIKHLDQITNILLVFSVINSSSREGSVCDIFPFYCCFFTDSQVTAGSVDFRLLGCNDLVGEWKSSRILENKAKTGKRMNCGHCVAASGLPLKYNKSHIFLQYRGTDFSLRSPLLPLFTTHDTLT